MKKNSLFLANKKQLAVLVDPDKQTPTEAEKFATFAEAQGADFFLVGGSLVSTGLDETVIAIKRGSKLPVFLFPGSVIQISTYADGILFISLISGRNPEFLIGSHVVAAPLLRKTKLEIVPAGYMLIDGGRRTSAEYMSNTNPIPRNKPDIAAATALAGQFSGKKVIYMDAGSGADMSIPEEMISHVKSVIGVPLMIGGGIRTPEVASKIVKAGADIIVIGTAAEENQNIIKEIAEAIKLG